MEGEEARAGVTPSFPCAMFRRNYGVGPMEIAIIHLSLFTSQLCCGGSLLVMLAIIGFVVLRRRGSQDVSAKAAVNAGVESVSQVFIRGKGGGLEPADDDD